MKFDIKKYLLLAFALSLLSIIFIQEAKAQKYTIAAGWRAGAMSNGVTMKVVPVQGVAVEGMVSFYPLGPSAGMTVQRSVPLFAVRALQFYAGLGAHYRFAYFTEEYYDPYLGYYTADPPLGDRGVGLDAVAGIELKIPILPIALNAEVKPQIEFTNYGNTIYGLDPGVGIKLAF